MVKKVWQTDRRIDRQTDRRTENWSQFKKNPLMSLKKISFCSELLSAKCGAFYRVAVCLLCLSRFCSNNYPTFAFSGSAEISYHSQKLDKDQSSDHNDKNINIGSGNDLLPDGTKPLPAPISIMAKYWAIMHRASSCQLCLLSGRSPSVSP